jgi:copper homeostasis protein
VTFHRAFDECPDLTAALDAVIETGARRILTSGGTTSIMVGLDSLAHLVKLAGDRIVIMPGGGIRSDNVEHMLQTTGAREIHSSLRGSQPNLIAPASFEERVRKFRVAVERTR